VGVGFNYANGPLKVDLVYQSRMNTVGSATKPYPAGTNKDINEGYIGASYDFKVVKIMGSYQQQNDKNTALTATGGSAGPVAGIGAVNQTNQTILGGIRHTF
jgi:predicted porin